MLEISETTLYDLIKRDGIKKVTVDYWIRIPKNFFRNGMRDSQSIGKSGNESIAGITGEVDKVMKNSEKIVKY